jgi:hypothetical protein
VNYQGSAGLLQAVFNDEAMKKLMVMAAALFCATLSFSQFNDSTHYMASYASTGVINKTNTRSSYVFSNILKFAMRQKSTTLNNFNSWTYGWQQRNLTNNDFSSTLDFNLYRTLPHFYYWGLTAYDKSYSLKINHRWQAGLGAAYSFVDRETAFVNISNGILYETGSLNVGDTAKDRYRTLRNSLRLRYRFVINNMITLDATHFWQPSLSDKKDYILKSNTTLAVRLYKWLNITAAANYNKVSRTRRENLLMTFGLAAERYF